MDDVLMQDERAQSGTYEKLPHPNRCQDNPGKAGMREFGKNLRTEFGKNLRTEFGENVSAKSAFHSRVILRKVRRSRTQSKDPVSARKHHGAIRQFRHRTCDSAIPQ